MSYPNQAALDPYISFERGMDREDTRTHIRPGGYEEAWNVLLGCKAHGAKHICTVKLDVGLDNDVSWPAGNPLYAQPFTYSTYSGGTLSFSTHLVIPRDTGAVWRYDTGSPGTTTLLRRGMNTGNKLWTHLVYDQWLILMNGRDAPMKYGQHFIGNTGNEARPFLFPLGSKPVTPCGAAIADENWTHGGAGAFVADASVPGGGSRVHTQSLRVAVSNNSFNSWGTARNFLTGPYPYGGTDLTGSDYLVFQVFKAAGAGAANVRVRFGNDAGTIYITFTQSISGSASWQTLRLLRSGGVVTGGFGWGSVKRGTFFNDDAA